MSIDLEGYRLTPEAQVAIETAHRANRKKRHSKRSGDWFVWGPIPGAYLTIAASLPGKALHVWLALWGEHHCRKGKPVRMTRELLSRFHVDPDSAYRALAHLERAGLLVAERRQGRLATVRLLLPTNDG